MIVTTPAPTLRGITTAVYHAEDFEAAKRWYAELLGMEPYYSRPEYARPHQPPRDFGEGFVGASVIDPFGTILGIMHNPHYVEVLAARRTAA